MLSELRIENLAVIPLAELELAEGLNVITGETGAGKTILAHAITLLLGARADSGLIRPGADEASVEAVFRVPEGCFADLAGEIVIPDDEDMSVRRRLSRDGRSRAWVGGRAVSLSVLGQLTGRLLAFSAQHEQRRLMMASHQMELLDAFGGAGLLAARAAYRERYRRFLALKEQLAALADDTGALAREVELLEFQAAEIAAAALVPGEDEELLREQRLLAGALELKGAAGALAAELGAAGGDGGQLMERLALSLARLEASAGVDAALDELCGRLRGTFFELEDVGRTARDYAEGLRHDPERLAEVEERLDLIAGLRRKYGGGIEEINGFGREAEARLRAMADSGQSRGELEQELAAAVKEAVEAAGSLRQLRQKAAAKLQKATTLHLRDLAFNRCDFEVRLEAAGGGEAAVSAEVLGPDGADSVEFFVCLNPGMPAAPLKDTASGGELSRIMLAVKSAAAGAGEAATLVFDEIDAGIGGETGAAVGAKLKGLAAASQIICITHLPQIASFADAHFSVTKSVDDETGTATAVSRLGGDAVVDELCRMMGSAPDDSDARAHAGSLLRKAQTA